MGYVMAASDWNPKLAWTFFQAHSDALTKRFSLFEKMLSLSNAVPAVFWDAATPDQLEAWLKTNLPSRANEYIAKGMSRAKTNGAIRDRLREDVRTFLATAEQPTPRAEQPQDVSRPLYRHPELVEGCATIVAPAEGAP